MRIKLKASDLIHALDVVSVVEPRSLTAQQNSSAYLFKCGTNAEGKPTCSMYSRGKENVARADFPLVELDGEGQFTIPAHRIHTWTQVPDDIITFESTVEVKPDGTEPVIRGSSSSGLTHDHTTYDPGPIPACDRDFEAAQANGAMTFVAGILREALILGKPFLPHDPANVGKHHLNTVQIFDQSNPDWAKGDGHMFCSDSMRAFYFQASDFEGKGLAVHSKFMGKLTEFLGKCSGPVTVYQSTNMTYVANDKGQIFGWLRDTKTHPRFHYLAMTRDTYVILVPRVPILSAIATTETVVDPKLHPVRLVYQHGSPVTGGGHTLHLASATSSSKFESFAVSTGDKPGEPSLEENFECYVSLAHFKSLFHDAKRRDVELRVCIIAKDEKHPRGGALLRTIDNLEMYESGKLVATTPGQTLNGTVHTCKVTRCMSSMV